MVDVGDDAEIPNMFHAQLLVERSECRERCVRLVIVLHGGRDAMETFKCPVPERVPEAGRWCRSAGP